MNYITQGRKWLIGLFAIALSLSISFAQIAAGCLLIFWLYRCLSKSNQRTLTKSPLDWPLALFFCWSIVSVVFRDVTGVIDVVRGQSAFLLFIWISRDFDLDDTNYLLKWFAVGAVVSASLGLIQYAGKVNYLPHEKNYVIPEFFSHWPRELLHFIALRNDRAVGARSHPLTYAESFIPAYFLLLGKLTQSFKEVSQSSKKLIIQIIGFALVVIGVVLAQGRAVWLGLVLGTIVFSLLKGRTFFLRTVILMLILIVPIGMVSSNRLWGRFMSIVSPASGSLGDQQSKSTRFTLWREALEQVRLNPISGLGYGQAKLKAVDPVTKEVRTWTETHNMYLQYLLELGFIGLGFFIWILFLIARIFWIQDFKWRPIFLGLLATFLVAGITESWHNDKEITMIFWVMVGCAEVLRRNEKA